MVECMVDAWGVNGGVHDGMYSYQISFSTFFQ